MSERRDTGISKYLSRHLRHDLERTGLASSGSRVPRPPAAVRVEGLRPMNRHAVHLSPDRATAAGVGARRGRAVVLSAEAGAMHRDGYVFRPSGNGVWRTDAVPSAYLRTPGPSDGNR